ncbi:uncharacterized protein CIMG_12857 [Coccidioides immitis RS]|uniref:Protein phosphatase 4 core regulatory subunit R2 n=1 Tax=Coccidioides immitis (strain RS) TaxID=246410 RepID=A0A0D8JTK1_COCIM|nr:uncharacterized protein CIMG_12857 [Coccidioides immitis RS]KJF60291.1 hypothetical protein CIMG_12857 [Coccidioides immitis RS]TPX26491.1 hypothetical protein DIZ76_011953 [Coccidioides immitis]
MLSDADVEVLEAVAKDGTMDYEKWPGLLELFLDQLHHIIRHEFPIPRFRSNSFETITTIPIHSTYASQDPSSQSNSNKENAPPSQFQSPPRRPPVPPFSPPATSMRIPDSQSQSSPSETDLPPPLQFLLSSIESTLRQSFSSKPPHTIQRLAELLLRPSRHYRTLPAYLRAVDRVVSVSSGADIFPLPVAVPPGVIIDSALANGVNGTTTSFSLFNDSSLGSDESLGGALLTPIPWLSNPTSPPASEDVLTQPSSSDDSIGAGTSAPSEPSSQEQYLSPETEGPNITGIQEVPEDEMIPHARGPSTIGVEDMGLQDGKDVQMTLTIDEPEATVAQDSQATSEESEGKEDPSTGLEEDGDGEIVVDDIPPSSMTQNDTPNDTTSSEANTAEPQAGGRAENNTDETAHDITK